MTHVNLTRVFRSIKETRRNCNKRMVYIFVDFKKAYDTVKRDKLFNIIWQKCTTDEERCLVKMLVDLFASNQIYYDGRAFKVRRGVM